nr:venom polypeptide precursor [Doratifera vulnerans]
MSKLLLVLVLIALVTALQEVSAGCLKEQQICYRGKDECCSGLVCRKFQKLAKCFKK